MICDAVQELLGKLPLIMWATDADLRLQWVRGGAVRLLGMDQMVVIGTAVEAVFGSADHPVAALLRKALQGETHSLQAEWLDRSYELWIEPLREESGAIAGTITVALDITESKRAETAMLQQAAVDTLTGALNRARLCERLETMLHQARRVGRDLAVVLVDVDGFSSINDSLRQQRGRPAALRYPPAARRGDAAGDGHRPGGRRRVRHRLRGR